MQAVIAFGANLGDPPNMFANVRCEFEQWPQVESVTCSRLYRTKAAGGPGQQPDFYNAAFSLDVQLSVLELFQHVRNLEYKMGRTRKARWDARTIDLDFLFADGLIHVDENLILPHPRLHYRQFVLQPMLDLHPDKKHPVFDLTTRQLADLFSQKTRPTLWLWEDFQNDALLDDIIAMILDELEKREMYGNIIPQSAHRGTHLVMRDDVMGVLGARPNDTVWNLVAGLTKFSALETSPVPFAWPATPAVDIRGTAPETIRPSLAAFLDSLEPPIPTNNVM